MDWFAYPWVCGYHTSETTDLTPSVSLGVAYCVAFLVKFTNIAKDISLLQDVAWYQNYDVACVASSSLGEEMNKYIHSTPILMIALLGKGMSPPTYFKSLLADR